jgi:hypothetical protein
VLLSYKRKFRTIVKNSDIAAEYLRLVAAGALRPTPELLFLLRTKRGKSASGILSVTVFTRRALVHCRVALACVRRRTHALARCAARGRAGRTATASGERRSSRASGIATIAPIIRGSHDHICPTSLAASAPSGLLHVCLHPRSAQLTMGVRAQL